MANGYSVPGYYNTSTRTTTPTYRPTAAPADNRFGEYTINPRADNPAIDQAPDPAAVADFQARRALRGTLDPYFQAGAFVGPGGRTALDNVLAGMGPSTAGGGGGGGGGRGRGGGGGGAGVDAATKAAYTNLYNQMKGSTAIDDAWAAYENAMRGVYDPAKLGAKWDAARGNVTTAGTQAQNRLAGIYDQMVARGATARDAVAAAQAAGQQRLQDIASRFGTMSGQATSGLGDILGRFDAGGLSNEGYQNQINQQANAAQLAQALQGNAFDAALADRPAIYAALNADINQGVTSQQQQLLNMLAGQQAAESQASSAQLAQILGQSGISRAQAAVQQQQDAAKLAAELAAMGIQV